MSASDTSAADTGYRVLDPRELHTAAGASQLAFAEDVLVGLSENPKRLPSRYFYDDAGSKLFQRITELEEYYPTAIEHSILTEHRSSILDRFIETPLNFVDLGAGDGRKTVVLLEYLLERGADVRYVPIDISEGAMITAVSKMRERFPTLRIEGLVSEYFDGLRWLGAQTDRLNLVLFLGSNIGNFNKPLARAFLRRLWQALNPDDRLLIGFDLKKDIEKLLAAYNDREGVTAAFNLNLLKRINTELGANFDVSKFRHFATYNVFNGAMESYLVSLEQQTVAIEALETEFRFAPWEPIHTEYSYKYLRSDLDHLAHFAHFRVEALFSDPLGWFIDALWQVEKPIA